MQNSIDDLNDFLFQSVKRLSNDKLSKEDLGIEVKRSLALSKVATNILNLQLLKLKAVKMSSEINGEKLMPTYDKILNISTQEPQETNISVNKPETNSLVNSLLNGES